MMKILKKIRGALNIPLIIFLLIVGSLLLIANINIEPVDKAKETVNKTVDDVSTTLNAAADSGDNSTDDKTT